MGHRLSSYRDMGGQKGAGWLDNWREAGHLACVLHREPPWTRDRHSFRKVVIDETDRGVKRKILWLPFTCWETPEYHKLRRFAERDNKEPPHPELCPADRLIVHLEKRDDLPDDEVIFSFKGGRKETRELLKVDLIGEGDTADGWKDDLTAVTEYVLAVLPLKDPTGFLLTNEKWSLGQGLLDRIKTDSEELGDDVGDPERRAQVYLFEYSKTQKKYSVSRFKEGQEKAEADGVWDSIVELWEGPAPDAEPYCRRGDPKELLESMQGAAVVDLPLDEIFAPSLAQWTERKEKEDEEATDFDPKKLEAEEKAAKAKAAQTRAAKAKAAKAAKAKSNGTAAKPESVPKKDRPKRAVRQVEKPKEPEEPEVQIFSCESCDADWPENLDKCPGCGLKVKADPNADIPTEPAGDESSSTGGAPSRDFKF